MVHTVLGGWAADFKQRVQGSIHVQAFIIFFLLCPVFFHTSKTSPAPSNWVKKLPMKGGKKPSGIWTQDHQLTGLLPQPRSSLGAPSEQWSTSLLIVSVSYICLHGYNWKAGYYCQLRLSGVLQMEGRLYRGIRQLFLWFVMDNSVWLGVSSDQCLLTEE